MTGSQVEPSVAKEAEEQSLVASDAAGADARDQVDGLDLVFAAVGQLPSLQVGPQTLDRVELGA